MSDLLPFIIAGLATGSVYGLAGTGLVLTYRTSGLFNFGQGAISAAAAYLFYWMHVEQDLDWKFSALVSVLGVGLVVGWLMEVVAERLNDQRAELKIVGTIGMILVAQSVAVILFGLRPRFVPQFLPGGENRIRILGVNITYDLIIITVIAVASVAVLFVLLERSRVGTEMRAVVDDPDLLAMQGITPARVRRQSWLIGSTFAALAGVLVAPLLGLDATVLTFLVVQAFGAAAIGYMTSLPLTFVGGLVIGVLADVAKRLVIDTPSLSGLPSAMPFIVLFAVLLLLPRRLLAERTSDDTRTTTPDSYVAPTRVRVLSGVVVVLCLGLVPLVVGAKVPFFTVGLATYVVLASLGLLVRTSGQVSLAHATFAAVGAVVFSRLTVDHGVPWLLAAVLAGLATVPVGMIVAVPAIRLSGLYLALATFGFGIMVQRVLYSQPVMFTSFSTGRFMPRPAGAESDFRFYYVVLGFAVAVGVLLAVVHQARLGRLLRALSSSPVAVTAMGLSTNVTRVVVFSISAFLAGIAGVLFGSASTFVNFGTPYYVPLFSLVLLATLALAPFGEPWYPLVPAVAAVIPAYWHSEQATDWLNLLFGVFAIGIAMKGAHPTMPMRLRRRIDRLGRGSTQHARNPSENVERPQPPSGSGGLVVRDLSVRFGGLTAADAVSFDAPLGQITGLIGPNGAGKTTLFNAVSGLNRAYTGTIELHTEGLDGLTPAARSRLGLGRTFQRVQLGNSLTVLENVSLGYESACAGASPIGQLWANRTERRESLARARQALGLTGIADLAKIHAGNLSTGQRRLVELARCIAGDFTMVLLDEPSSGLDGEETARFSAVVESLVRDRGIGFVLVEHDVELVMDVCQTIYVMDFGRMIASGVPDEIRTNPDVQAAYLGTPVVK